MSLYKNAKNSTTYKNGQTSIAINVFQGERGEVADNRALGKLLVQDIPPLSAGGAKIAVDFALNADGLLTVSAQELSQGTLQSVVLQPSQGLDAQQMQTMLLHSQKIFFYRY